MSLIIPESWGSHVFSPKAKSDWKRDQMKFYIKSGNPNKDSSFKTNNRYKIFFFCSGREAFPHMETGNNLIIQYDSRSPNGFKGFDSGYE